MAEVVKNKLIRSRSVKGAQSVGQRGVDLLVSIAELRVQQDQELDGVDAHVLEVAAREFQS